MPQHGLPQPSPASKTLIIWGVVIAGCLAIFLCGGGIGAYFYFTHNPPPAHPSASAKTLGPPTSASSHSRELSNRAICAANLRGIMQSMVVYSADNDDYYPYITNKSALSVQAPTDASLSGGVMQNVFYLAGQGDVGTKQFLCKSDPATTAISDSPFSRNGYPGYAPTYFQNTSGPNDFCYSYSFAQPFYGNTLGAWWKNTMDSSCPIAADINPGACWMATNEVAKKGNSINHQGDGQNVAFGDCHVEFMRTPLAGEANDHIYTQGNDLQPATPGTPGSATAVSTPHGNIQGTFDIWLVPAATGANYDRQ